MRPRSAYFLVVGSQDGEGEFLKFVRGSGESLKMVVLYEREPVVRDENYC